MERIRYHWENWEMRYPEDGMIDFLVMTITNGKIVVEYGNENLEIKRIITDNENPFIIDDEFAHIHFPKENTDLQNVMCDGYNEELSIDKVHVKHVAMSKNLIIPFHKVVNRIAGFDILETCMKQFKKHLKVIKK